MQGFTVAQCHDTQILAQFINLPPVAKVTIWLNIGMFSATHCLFAPLQFKTGTLFQHTISKVWRLLHANTRNGSRCRMADLIAAKGMHDRFCPRMSRVIADIDFLIREIC